MALTVNTNIASLSAQRNLTASQGELSTSLQRLSSGLRINSAKDDAAGLAISERFTAQINGLNQGVRNANDGISLAQTAEGALKEVTSNLQRIRELAVQSANATNSDSDRAALKAESDQLVAEINRVATNTKFNGINLLDGTFANKAFQVGADAGETVSVTSIGSSKTSDLGQSYAATTAALTLGGQASNGSNLTINNVAIGASGNDGSGSADPTKSAKSIAAAINAAGAGVTATAGTTSVAGGGTPTDLAANLGTLQITINGVDVGTATNLGTADQNEAQIEALVNANSAATGVTASDATGALVFTAADGRNISITATNTAVGGSDADDFGMGAFIAGTIVTSKATVTLSSTDTIVVDDNLDGGGNVLAGDATTTKALTGTAISLIDISSVSGASTAITSIDAALSTISATRSDLGSYQSRFESIVANSQTSAENLSASRSRIMDADFAAETAQLTKSQILQQSGIAMLAQANSIPQNVLALLQ